MEVQKTKIYKTITGYDTNCDTNTGITSSPLVEDYDENKHEIDICKPPLNSDLSIVEKTGEKTGGRRRKSKKSKKAKKTKKSKKSKKTKKSRKH